ncbi:hypothetical protein JOQ06_006882, partial [Pogonophryne albipinna]
HQKRADHILLPPPTPTPGVSGLVNFKDPFGIDRQIWTAASRGRSAHTDALVGALRMKFNLSYVNVEHSALRGPKPGEEPCLQALFNLENPQTSANSLP